MSSYCYRRTIILCFVVLASLPLWAGTPIYTDLDKKSALDTLDSYLSKQELYFDKKGRQIALFEDSIAQSAPEDSCRLLIALGNEYRRFDVDSAASAYRKARETATRHNDTLSYIKATLSLCDINPLRDIVKESIENFEKFSNGNLPDQLKNQYYDTGFNLYLTSALYYPDNSLASEYSSKARAFGDSLANNLEDGSAHKLYHRGWNALYDGNPIPALAALNEALSRSEPGDDFYPLITSAIADCYERYLNDNDKSDKFLTLSAISDAMSGTRETTSLQRLGLKLFQEGGLERAYQYLTTALHNSVNSGSRVRTLSEINALPVVSAAYRRHDKQMITWLFAASIAAVTIIVVLLVVLHAYRKSLQQLAKYRSRQQTNDSLKDKYITHLLELCSTYIARLEDLNKLMLRKLKAGQTGDLLRLAESGEFLKEQNERFLVSFDETFLDNYPDFIKNLNTLLKPDEQFSIDKRRRLSPELRIAALMRLGIDDGTRISHFLGLSLNTIYTYRNKLKNRVLDRSDFEAKIRNI